MKTTRSKSRIQPPKPGSKTPSSKPVVTPKVQILEVDDDVAGQRIDNFLTSRLKGVPKSLIYRVLRKGEVRVNKGRIKPEYKLKAGDLVRVPPIRVAAKAERVKPGQGLVQLLSKSILYEDDDLLVVNKPAGLAVHGGSGVNLGLIESLRQIRDQDRFLELIHRLDKATSGCVMIAKSRRCLRYMQQLLRERNHINKVYNALVIGRWPQRRKQIQVALLKNKLASGERIVRAVEEETEGAKSSLTNYRVLKHFKGCSLVEAKPITGRTHQIRVHSQYAGHAILGDEKYGDSVADGLIREIGLRRLFLHAAKLEFTTVDKVRVTVEAPLSAELLTVLSTLSSEV
jgi:23S rRNA pseudouridine955/2504/2580 synthase